jgi:hypothetical protein
MKRDSVMTRPLKSSFLSCEKDVATIIKKLFVSSRPYSDILKKLLIINTKDCIDENSVNQKLYQEKIDSYSVNKLLEEKYITQIPKIRLLEHEEVKSYIIISFSDFTPTDNPEYRDCTITFSILCHSDYWDLNNLQLRPLKIAGYIDGILDNTRLSGIGKLDFLTCDRLVLDENLSGYSLSYVATHGNDDTIPPEEE